MSKVATLKIFDPTPITESPHQRINELPNHHFPQKIDDCVLVVNNSKNFIPRDNDFSDSRMFNNFYSSIVVEDVFDPIVRAAPIMQPAPVVEPAPVVVPTPAVVAPAFELTPEPQGISYVSLCEMTEKEYYTGLKAIESKAFSDEKMATAMIATKDKCMTNEQIWSFARLFNFEEQTLEFVKYAYDQASEKSTYYTLEDVFKFLSSREAFTKFLRSK